MASYVLSKVGGVHAKSDSAVRSVVGGFLFLCLVANVDKAAKGAQGDDDDDPEDEERGPAEDRERPAAEGGERPAAQASGAGSAAIDSMLQTL
jgi:hypothetical protein